MTFFKISKKKGLQMSNTHSYDFYSHFSDSSKYREIADSYSQIQLCSLNKKERLEDYKKVIGKLNLENAIQLLHKFDLYKPTVNINVLPVNSFFVQFKIKLKKPFYSKDDEQFYIIDNPICKESVFKVPMMRSSGWAGALKNAIIQTNDKNKHTESVNRLFGYAAYNEDDSKKGFLMFFPSFFSNIKFEIINPHDRKTKAGINPIYYEVVPAGSIGTFSLLYVPIYFEDDEKPNANEKVVQDIDLISRGLKDMFLVYGFGAKTSSGFGIVEDNLPEGKITLKTKIINASTINKVTPPGNVFNKYLNEDGTIKDSFKDTKGELITQIDGEKLSLIGGGSLKEFKRFKGWYKIHGCDWQKHLQSANETSAEWPFWAFDTFDGLINAAREIKQKLFEEEGQ